ncbi:MAG: DUF421 domain-containing protein [Xanthobacteraceae bacterium]|jgi:uncharacterized membrane protein YcaP (DUF421 family)
MDTIIRSLIIYFVLWGLLRLSGRRTLGKMTSFDLVLLLVIGGVTQRALLGQDYSVINALLVIVTLILTDVALSLLQRDFPPLSKLFNGEPMIVVEDGRPLLGRLKRARLTAEQVLEAGRRIHGLERMDQIKYAILEASGEISIIPYSTRQVTA